MITFFRTHLWLAVAATLVLAVVISACNGDDSNDADNGNGNTNPDNDEQTSEVREPQIEEDTPDPVDVSAEEVSLVSEWEMHNVPKYEDVEASDFDSHAGEIENAGTILFVTEDPGNDVIAYLRGALGELGWEERRASPDRIFAEREDTAITISITPVDDGGSMIMMILTDRF